MSLSVFEIVPYSSLAGVDPQPMSLSPGHFAAAERLVSPGKFESGPDIVKQRRMATGKRTCQRGSSDTKRKATGKEKPRGQGTKHCFDICMHHPGRRAPGFLVGSHCVHGDPEPGMTASTCNHSCGQGSSVLSCHLACEKVDAKAQRHQDAGGPRCDRWRDDHALPLHRGQPPESPASSRLVSVWVAINSRPPNCKMICKYERSCRVPEGLLGHHLTWPRSRRLPRATVPGGRGDDFHSCSAVARGRAPLKTLRQSCLLVPRSVLPNDPCGD